MNPATRMVWIDPMDGDVRVASYSEGRGWDVRRVPKATAKARALVTMLDLERRGE